MLWKLNAAFPSVIWQIYDWYLEPNAGYYFMQNACEPIHVQMNADDSSVVVVNRSFLATQDIHCSVELFTLEGKSVLKNIKNLRVGPADINSVLDLRKELRSLQGIHFLVLNLTDINGAPVSHNVYWLSGGNDFKSLRDMPKVRLQTKLTRTETAAAEENKWTYEISNPSANVAFFVNPQLWNESEEIMPTFWSSNYFSLAPGEKITVIARCPKLLSVKKPLLKLDGWNISGN